MNNRKTLSFLAVVGWKKRTIRTISDLMTCIRIGRIILLGKWKRKKKPRQTNKKPTQYSFRRKKVKKWGTRTITVSASAEVWSLMIPVTRNQFMSFVVLQLQTMQMSAFPFPLRMGKYYITFTQECKYQQNLATVIHTKFISASFYLDILSIQY